jgi:5-methylcytosine-specific restriction endonuclease McrA
MTRVFVLDKDQKPLMPCLQARARELLKKGKAAVFRLHPFTIILKNRQGGNLQSVEYKLDPGGQTTGIAVVGHFLKGKKVLWAGHLLHRRKEVRESLTSRRAFRKSRRSRHLRYRAARFNNRKSDRLFAPSIQSVVQNILNWFKRIRKFCPINFLAVEIARFDTQKMLNPEISGIEYTQGTLTGYEVREYLLEKFKHTCTYCGARKVPVEIDHVVPRSLGGSNRISNLILACRPCNVIKGNLSLTEFLKDSQKSKKILSQLEKPLDAASCVNTIRSVLMQSLKGFSLPTTSSTGAVTKWNRSGQGYAKEHWIDAACVGPTGEQVYLPKYIMPLEIHAKGRGSRQMCRVNAYGFPRTSSKTNKRVYSFQTGDLVQALVAKGKKKGRYHGRLAVRTSGYFNIHTSTEKIQGIHARDCRLMQRADGYDYKQLNRRTPSSNSTRLLVSGVSF